MTLAAIFSPDRLDWGQPPLAPGAPSSLHHQYFAIARRFLRDRHIRQGPPSIAPQKSLPPSIPESARKWRYPNVLQAMLFTGTPSIKRRRYFRTPVAHPWACARHQPCAHRLFRPNATVPVSTPRHAFKIHPSLPRISPSSLLLCATCSELILSIIYGYILTPLLCVD